MRRCLLFWRKAKTDFCAHWGISLIQWGLWWLVFSVFFSAIWIRQKFGFPTFNQFLFHIQLGYHGLLAAEYYTIKSYVVSCVILPGLGALATASGAVTTIKNVAAFDRRIRNIIIAAPITCLALSCAFLLNQVSFFAYAESLAGEDYFSGHFKDPKTVSLTEKNPRNLVLIYVESLDAAYSDPKIFGKDLLHSLDGPAIHGISFNEYNQAPGTNWTIAGIVSTQCGVPLEIITVYDRNVQGEKLNAFMPGAVCLGDVLSDYGYQNIFMGGAGLSFAGKGQFFKDHHYAERYGRDEWAAQGDKEEDMSGWGLHDDDLFRHAETKLDSLEASGRRFNLTLLTLDTHYQGTEKLSKTCAKRGVKSFEDLVECTADQVADFITYTRQKGYLNNTDIVVLGDHLAMSNPVIDKLTRVPERHIFNLFVSNNIPHKRREDIVHFDLFPTILDFIGLHVQKSQMALGYSGFSATEPAGHSGRLADMRRDLLHPSPLYYDLWKYPEVSYGRDSSARASPVPVGSI